MANAPSRTPSRTGDQTPSLPHPGPILALASHNKRMDCTSPPAARTAISLSQQLNILPLTQRLPHELAQLGSNIRPLQSVSDRRGQQPQRRTRIVAHTGKLQAEAMTGLSLPRQRVGQLNLPTPAGRSVLQQGKDIRSDDITTIYRQIRGRLLQR